MTSYFKLRCFEPETTKKIIVIGAIIVSITGVIHWGYFGVLSSFLNLYYNYAQGTATLLVSYNQYKKLMQSPMAYFAITGIQQILSSVLVGLVALGYIGTTSKSIWTRVLTISVLFNFAFNFVIAVASSMNATYYNQLFKDFLSKSNSITGGLGDDWAVQLVIMVKYITAEAVLTFLISLPIIGLTGVALAQNSFRDFSELQTQISVEPHSQQIKIVSKD